MITHGGHERYLAQELRTGGEEIVIPVAVIALGRNEITVHERDVAVEIADEVLHVRPILAGIAVDVADGEDTEGLALLRSGLGAAHLIEAAGRACTDREVITGVGLQAGEGDDMHIAFVGHFPSVGREDGLVEIRRIGTVTNDRIGGCSLVRHLPEDLDGCSGRRHGVRLFVGDIGFAGRVVFVFRNAPPRVAERAVVRSGIDSQTVGEEPEVTVRRIHEIGIACRAVRLRSAGTYLHGRIETDAVMHVRVSTIGGKTIGVLPLLGIHEDTVGNTGTVDIRGIDAARVSAVVEGTMVDDHRSFQCRYVVTRIDIDEATRTIGTTVEGTIGDCDALDTCGCGIDIDGTIAVGRLGPHAEDTIVYAEVDRSSSVHLYQVIRTDERHTLERKVRIYLDPFGGFHDRLCSFCRFDGQRHGCGDGRSLVVLTGG